MKLQARDFEKPPQWRAFLGCHVIRDTKGDLGSPELYAPRSEQLRRRFAGQKILLSPVQLLKLDSHTYWEAPTVCAKIGQLQVIIVEEWL